MWKGFEGQSPRRACSTSMINKERGWQQAGKQNPYCIQAQLVHKAVSGKLFYLFLFFFSRSLPSVLTFLLIRFIESMILDSELPQLTQEKNHSARPQELKLLEMG